jgi:SAM-dependent methyltransferase
MHIFIALMRSELTLESPESPGAASPSCPPAPARGHPGKMMFFEARAALWDTNHACPPGEERILPLIIPFLRLGTGLRVLDLGCGTGKLVPWLRESVGPSGLVVEADFCRGMLEAGRDKRFGRRVRFLRMDAQLPAVARAAFDRIVCFALFPHLEDQAGTLRELLRLLRPGSPLVIAHSMGREELNAHFRKVGGPLADDRLPDGPEMASMLSAAGFRDIDIIDRPRYYIARAWA